jgi:hypothetical protein
MQLQLQHMVAAAASSDNMEKAPSIHAALLPGAIASRGDAAGSASSSPQSESRPAHRRAMSLADLPLLDDVDSIELYHLQSKNEMIAHTSATTASSSSSSSGMNAAGSAQQETRGKGANEGGGSFSIRTSGLALRSTATNRLVVLEYRPVNYDACYLPQLGPLPGSASASGGGGGSDTGTGGSGTNPADSSSSLIWDNRAFIEYTSSLDLSHWQQSTFLGTINGVVYSNYIAWLRNYIANTAANIFVPAAICSSISSDPGPNSASAACFTFAHTWETFLWSSFDQFASMSVSMHAMLPPRSWEIQLLTHSEPQIIKADPKSTRHGGSSSSSSSVSKDSQSGWKRPDSGLGARARSRALGSVREAVAPVPDTEAQAQALAPSNTGIPAFLEELLAASGKEVPHVSELDIYYYYTALVACMNGYTNEEYASALTSCTAGDVGYVHVWGDYYYLIKPRQPFAANVEYFQTLPAAQYPTAKGMQTSDWLFGVGLLAMIACGMLFGFRKLNMHEASCYNDGCCSWCADAAGQKVSHSYMPVGANTVGIVDAAEVDIESEPGQAPPQRTMPWRGSVSEGGARRGRSAVMFACPPLSAKSPTVLNMNLKAFTTAANTTTGNSSTSHSTHAREIGDMAVAQTEAPMGEEGEVDDDEDTH